MNTPKLGKQSIPERSILKEKNDCTVRALMDGLEVPYLEAYGMMIGLGRRKGRGSWVDKLVNPIALSKVIEPGMSVKSFVSFIAHSGRWLVVIRGHIFAVVEGEIRDEFPAASLNCHVRMAWRMK